MFPVFHLAWSNCRATKTFVAGWRKLLRKVERGSTLSNKFWLCCSFFIKLTTCRATNLLVTWKINQSARRISSTRNKCFCCGSSWSRKVKNGKHRRKLATKQCCATSWGFLYLVFRRLNSLEEQQHELARDQVMNSHVIKSCSLKPRRIYDPTGVKKTIPNPNHDLGVITKHLMTGPCGETVSFMFPLELNVSCGASH